MVMCGRGNPASSSCRIQRDKLAPGHSYNKLLICSGGRAARKPCFPILLLSAPSSCLPVVTLVKAGDPR